MQSHGSAQALCHGNKVAGALEDCVAWKYLDKEDHLSRRCSGWRRGRSWLLGPSAGAAEVRGWQREDLNFPSWLQPSGRAVFFSITLFPSPASAQITAFWQHSQSLSSTGTLQDAGVEAAPNEQLPDEVIGVSGGVSTYPGWLAGRSPLEKAQEPLIGKLGCHGVQLGPLSVSSSHPGVRCQCVGPCRLR